jgi:hypothetical protein
MHTMTDRQSSAACSHRVTDAVVATRLASQFVWGRNLSCYAEGHLQGLSLLTDRVHYFGGLIAAQMSIGFGRQGHSYDHFRE